MARRTIDDVLAEAQRSLPRLEPAEAYAAARNGAVLVDTRSPDYQHLQGFVPGARHHPLSVLEWRLDPDSGYGDPTISLDSYVILICREGYSSSLAALRLRELGFTRATDVVGGVDAWKAAGLPVVDGDLTQMRRAAAAAD